MRVLFVVPYVPTVVRVRPRNLIRHLVLRGHQVTLATVWENEDERGDLRHFATDGVEVIAAPLARPRKLWNCARALPTRMPLQAAFCDSPALRQSLIARLTRGVTFDVAHVEHLRGALYGLAIKQSAAVPVVWDSVDCISHLFEQAAQWGCSLRDRLIARAELERTRRHERWLATRFDGVLVTSPTDKDALDRLVGDGPVSRTTVLPNGVDLAYFSPSSEPREEDTVVFTGKMSYHANATAALYLAREVMPLVWRSRPSAHLVIAGSRPTTAVRVLAEELAGRVEVTGHVADMRQPLRRATVSVAPLLYGAGIQNKVLEAMACGTPVVASPLAISALQAGASEACLVADGVRLTAEAIVRLLGDAAWRARLGAAGRAYVERHHDWSAVAARLECVYSETVGSQG